jgi:hypothetical protein
MPALLMAFATEPNRHAPGYLSRINFNDRRGNAARLLRGDAGALKGARDGRLR